MRRRMVGMPDAMWAWLEQRGGLSEGIRALVEAEIKREKRRQCISTTCPGPKAGR